MFQEKDQEAARIQSPARTETTVSTETVAMAGYGRRYDSLIVSLFVSELYTLLQYADINTLLTLTLLTWRIW